MSQDAVSREQFTGFIHPRHLIPTEHVAAERWKDPGSASAQYLDDLREHVRAHGMPEPIEAYYSDRGQHGLGRRQKPKLYIDQGHHRRQVAMDLRMQRVPVKVKSGIGRPPELEDE